MSTKKKRIDRRKARAWMVMEGIRARSIQLALGHRYQTQVIETLLGDRSHRKVLAWLRDHGCPVEYLELPSDMRKMK